MPLSSSSETTPCKTTKSPIYGENIYDQLSRLCSIHIPDTSQTKMTQPSVGSCLLPMLHAVLARMLLLLVRSAHVVPAPIQCCSEPAAKMGDEGLRVEVARITHILDGMDPMQYQVSDINITWPYMHNHAYMSSNQKKSWDHFCYLLQDLWVFPKIVVPPNHPF